MMVGLSDLFYKKRVSFVLFNRIHICGKFKTSYFKNISLKKFLRQYFFIFSQILNFLRQFFFLFSNI